MNTPTNRQSRATALATVAFATLVFTTAPAPTRESWPQRIEADWLLASEVAQVSKPAVSQISKSAFAANVRGARRFQSSAGLETGDTADSEVCVTTAFATLLFTTAPAATRESWPQRIAADWLLVEEIAPQDQPGGLVTALPKRKANGFPLALRFSGLNSLSSGMLGLVWAFGRHAEVIGLFLRELGQLHADAVKERQQLCLVTEVARGLVFRQMDSPDKPDAL